MFNIIFILTSSIYYHFTQIYTHFTQLGTINENQTKQEIKSDVISPEPVIEEPSSPSLPDQVKKANREIAEIVEIDENSQLVESEVIVEEPPKRKPGRGKSVQFDIIEEEQKSEPVTPMSEEIPKNLPQRGRSASREEADIIEIKEVETAKTPKETDIPKTERRSSVHATIEEAEVVVSETKSQAPVEEEIPQKKLQRAISAQKADADVVENEVDKKPEKVVEKTVERQESQKGVKDIEEEEDEEVEALLKRAQKQRSLIQDIDKQSDIAQGILSHLTFCIAQRQMISKFYTTHSM